MISKSPSLILILQQKRDYLNAIVIIKKKTMRFLIVVILMAILLVDAAFGFYTFNQMKTKHNRRQAMLAKHNYERLPEKYFAQKMDHFLLQDTRTWKQRYFIDTSFWSGKGKIYSQDY